MAFHGFRDPETETVDGSDLYPVALYLTELGEIIDLIGKRLGGRVQSIVRVQARDTQPGREYFFDNLEVRRRGAPGQPSFVGVYHYRAPERFRGSHFMAWRASHDDDPGFSMPLSEFVAAARAAFAQGRSPQWLDEIAEEVKKAIGL